jgi:hypothetical protein
LIYSLHIIDYSRHVCFVGVSSTINIAAAGSHVLYRRPGIIQPLIILLQGEVTAVLFPVGDIPSDESSPLIQLNWIVHL